MNKMTDEDIIKLTNILVTRALLNTSPNEWDKEKNYKIPICIPTSFIEELKRIGFSDLEGQVIEIINRLVKIGIAKLAFDWSDEKISQEIDRIFEKYGILTKNTISMVKH